MTLAAIDWLSVSINLLLVLFVIVCLLMTLLILMQRPKQEGLGAAFGGGVTDQVFGARTTNVLQRGTVYLGSLFFILSLTLAILVGQKNKQKVVVDDKKPAAEAPAEDAASLPVPATPEGPKSLAQELPVDVSPQPQTSIEITPEAAAGSAPVATEPQSPQPESAEEQKSEDKPADSGR